MSISILHNISIFKDAVKHLRFSFSFFLLPVYLFALSQVTDIDVIAALTTFLALHFLVYPSSNGYNSYMDQDEGSIGGLKKPPQAPDILGPMTLIMDIIGILLVLLAHPQAAVVTLAYIMASRAYSSRKFRLKRFPITGYLTVVTFQGGAVFLISFMVGSQTGLAQALSSLQVWLGIITSIFLIGAAFPLTQVYQHEQDRNDGVKTLSRMLGHRGTFIFSILLFFLATLSFLGLQLSYGDLIHFLVFPIFLLPSIIILLNWMRKVWQNTDYANYQNAMLMTKTGSLCLNGYFLFLLIINLI